MASSYTSLLGLVQPTTGELSGTWGTTVNDYLTAYLDSAVAGVQTISGTQTAVTLSVTNGATLSQAGSGATGSSQYMVINCTGTPASLLTITAPAASKVYVVINGTAQSVKLVGAGPTTGVTMITGEKAVCAWNGSDFVKVATSAATGGITYTTTKTSNYTASANDGVLTNTTAGAFTVTLPASPSNGDQVIVADAAGTWGTNNLTVGRNGNNIADVAQDLVCDISGASVQFVYNSSGTASWEVFAQIGGNGGTAVTLTGTQTLTNKTLTAPTIASANLTTALTLAGAAGTNGQVLTSAGSGLPSWTTIAAGYTLGTPVTASGTSVSFTGIPAGIKQIVMTFSGISTNGTGGVIIQIGDSGGFETTGTNSTGTKIIVGTADTDNGGGPEIGFFIYSNLTANTLWGSVILTLHNSSTFTWAAQGVFSSGSGSTFTTAGRKSLSAELDRIRIITPNGTDTFDDGAVNIAYI